MSEFYRRVREAISVEQHNREREALAMIGEDDRMASAAKAQAEECQVLIQQLDDIYRRLQDA